MGCARRTAGDGGAGRPPVRTPVVDMGEIGRPRTPKINAGAGRDHWGLCYTVLFAGTG
jgi:hypothetical protein